MMMSSDRYTYRVTWSEEDNEYVGLCVEFPSLSWLARLPEEALKGIRQVVADVVADLEANGELVLVGVGDVGVTGRRWLLVCSAVAWPYWGQSGFL